MALVQCRDGDGWQWTSRRRDFDLSLCVEEGLVLTSLLSIFTVVALVRINLLSYTPGRVISRNGRWRLWAKLVGLLEASFAYFARVDSVFRHFLGLPSSPV